jgi:uncharacterized protein YjiS (DUF1127 family)
MSKLTSFKTDSAFWPLADQPRPGTEPSKSWAQTLLMAPARAATVIAREFAARRAMSKLAALDDRLLRDIGIERDQIASVARRGRTLPSAGDVRADVSRWV